MPLPDKGHIIMTQCAPKRSALRLGVLLLPFSVLAACADRAPFSPDLPSPELPGGAVASRTFDCVADVRAGSVSCAAAGAGASGASRAIVGGQNTFVRLASSNVAYNSGTGAFTFDVTLTNLLGVTAGTYPQAMGTADGVNADADGMRVFFNSGPTATSGSGTITVQTADSAALTSSEKQPLYRYNGILEPGTTTAAQGWALNVPSSVNTFAFTLYVATQLEPAVVITELMANPAGVLDENAEYVEIRNMGIAPVSLFGWIVQDGTSNQTSGTCTPTTTPACFGSALPGAVDTIDAPVVIAAGATALLGRSPNTALNGGITPDYVYTTSVAGGLQLGNTQCNGGTGCVTDFFRIRTPNAVTIDSAAYRLTGTSAAAGTAREVLDPFVDNSNVDGANYKSATNVYDATNNNKGTPSASGGTPPAGGGNGS
ncbi:MAG TPA: lamin tail domain-containing protein, partial [Longimicrobium sp.]|nr:lamin tail domain-containing protein [Longimicrobium sp.]